MKKIASSPEENQPLESTQIHYTSVDILNGRLAKQVCCGQCDMEVAYTGVSSVWRYANGYRYVMCKRCSDKCPEGRVYPEPLRYSQIFPSREAIARMMLEADENGIADTTEGGIWERASCLFNEARGKTFMLLNHLDKTIVIKDIGAGRYLHIPLSYNMASAQRIEEKYCREQWDFWLKFALCLETERAVWDGTLGAKDCLNKTIRAWGGASWLL